jgi:hypothetical protein
VIEQVAIACSQRTMCTARKVRGKVLDWVVCIPKNWYEGGAGATTPIDVVVGQLKRIRCSLWERGTDLLALAMAWKE